MHPRRRSLWADSLRLHSEASLGVTLFASESYVTRSEALALHLGQRELDRPAHFLVPLRRALARIAPGAFDAPPRNPWRRAECRGGAFRLDVCPGGDAELEAAVDAAGEMGLSVYDATTRETSQPMRLDRQDVLADALGDLENGGYVVLEGGPGDDIYVQAFADEGNQLQLEAVAQHHLPLDLTRTLPCVDALDALGFVRPTGDETPNHFTTLLSTTRRQQRHAAERMVRALLEGYGAAMSETYRLRCSGT
ncbi:MAG: hypothetical protein AAF500_01020 [Myxococcota bacterium]